MPSPFLLGKPTGRGWGRAGSDQPSGEADRLRDLHALLFCSESLRASLTSEAALPRSSLLAQLMNDCFSFISFRLMAKLSNIFIVLGSKSPNCTPLRLPLPPCLLAGCPGRKKPHGHHSPVWLPLGLGAQAPSPAMSGQPLTAPNITVFPTRNFPESIPTAPPCG